MENWWAIEGHGNYWSDWTLPDNDMNGIVDTPYNISGGSAKDNYPLTESPGEAVPQDSTAVLSGAVGSNGWYTSEVLVTLSYSTRYRYDDNTWWGTYGQPLDFGDNGYHVLDFYSIYIVNCSESIKSVAF